MRLMPTENAGTVFKICSSIEWRQAGESGVYAGSTDDARDGFIHLSTAEQLTGTLARHFAGRGDLLVIGFDALALGTALRWETSRGGALFPHLHGELPVRVATGVWPVPLGPGGEHELPGHLKTGTAGA